MFEAAAMMAIEGAIMLSWLRRRQEAQTGTAEGAYIRDHGAGAYGEARERDVILTDVIESDHAISRPIPRRVGARHAGVARRPAKRCRRKSNLSATSTGRRTPSRYACSTSTGVRVHLAIEGEARGGLAQLLEAGFPAAASFSSRAAFFALAISGPT